ncbi:MAG: hypothetical protein IT215_05990 [Chitinophagaceae bacterium]|nr:hypothetical protein [Chitinophagaceae bacterium]
MNNLQLQNNIILVLVYVGLATVMFAGFVGFGWPKVIRRKLAVKKILSALSGLEEWAKENAASSTEDPGCQKFLKRIFENHQLLKKLGIQGSVDLKKLATCEELMRYHARNTYCSGRGSVIAKIIRGEPAGPNDKIRQKTVIERPWEK